MLPYIMRFKAIGRKAEARGVALPDALNAYLILRRSALTYEDRKLVLATAQGELDFGQITTALRKLFGDDELRKADEKYIATKRAKNTRRYFDTKQQSFVRGTASSP